jgi:hypothetical protein
MQNKSNVCDTERRPAGRSLKDEKVFRACHIEEYNKK